MESPADERRQEPCTPERAVVTECLEDRSRALSNLQQLGSSSLGIRVDARSSEFEPCAQLEAPVAGRDCFVDGFDEDVFGTQRAPRRSAAQAPTHKVTRAAADRLLAGGSSLEPGGSRMPGRPRVRARARPRVRAVLRLPGAESAHGPVPRAELGAVTVRLLEVVADDFVGLALLAVPANRQLVRGGRRAPTSGCRRTPRRESGRGESAARLHGEARTVPAGRAPCARATSGGG